MKSSILSARIAELETDLLLWGPALTKLALGVASYTIDTGQTKQVVQRHQLKDLQSAYRGMWDEYSDLCNRTGSAVIVAAPAW